MKRLIELADYFEQLRSRIPKENEAPQPWQDELVEAVGECFDHSADSLTALVHPFVPIARVAAFKNALRKLRERVGRYSATSNPEIEAALAEVIATFEEIRTTISVSRPPIEAGSAPARSNSLSDDVVTLTGKLYDWDQQRSDTNATFNTRAVAEALEWAPERMNRAV